MNLVHGFQIRDDFRVEGKIKEFGVSGMGHGVKFYSLFIPVEHPRASF